MKVILDTNVFVAAQFNRRSHSAEILRAVEEGSLQMVWHEATRAETRKLLRQIPKLSWQSSEPLFRPENELRDALVLGCYDFVPDLDDRKFAALAELAGCTIVTSDSDLLSNKDLLTVPVLTPRQFIEAHPLVVARPPARDAG